MMASKGVRKQKICGQILAHKLHMGHYGTMRQWASGPKDELLGVVVIYNEDKPVGAGIIKLYPYQTRPYIGVYVKPSHRKQGLGSQLAKRLVGISGQTKLVTWTGTRAALKLYKKVGLVS